MYLNVEQNKVSLNTQLNDLVASTPLGEFIKNGDYISHLKECSDLYQLYLSDFINFVYRTTKEKEFKVVTCVLLQSIMVHFL